MPTFIKKPSQPATKYLFKCYGIPLAAIHALIWKYM